MQLPPSLTEDTVPPSGSSIIIQIFLSNLKQSCFSQYFVTLKLPLEMLGTRFSCPSWSVCVAAMKADRKRLKVEKSDLVSQMQQLYTTLENREEQLREFIRNYDQHRKVIPVQPMHLYERIADMSAVV